MLLTKLMMRDVRRRLPDEVLAGRDVLDPTAGIAVPAYGMGRGDNLTRGSIVSMQKALSLQERYGGCLFFSSAFGSEEGVLKRWLFPSTAKAHWVTEIRNSYDEAAQFIRELKRLNIQTTAIVAEENHLPRFLLAMHLLAPQLHLVPVSFTVKMEPYIGRGLRGYTAHPLIWELFNFIMYMITPQMVKRYI